MTKNCASPVATGLEGYHFQRNHRSPGPIPISLRIWNEKRFPLTSRTHCSRLPPRTASRGAGAVKRAAPSCACAAQRAPLSAVRRTVPKSPGGPLDTGEPGGISGPRLRRRHPRAIAPTFTTRSESLDIRFDVGGGPHYVAGEPGDIGAEPEEACSSLSGDTRFVQRTS